MDTQAIRKKILDLALRGKLTEQLPEDGTGQELFQDIQERKAALVRTGKTKKQEPIIPLSEEDTPFEIPDNWQWVRLGDITSKITSGSTPTGGKKSDAYVDKGFCFFREQNIYNDGIHSEGMVYITEQLLNTRENSTVIAKDILLNITGGSIGRCAIVPDDFSKGSINQHILIIRMVEEETRFFTHMVLCSPYAQNHIKSKAVGDKDGFSGGRCKYMPVPLPPLPVQKRIVSIIHSAFSVLDTIDTLQSQYQDNLATLKSKIIDAGIQGKLTEQLPEDGTAEELYQQIHANQGIEKKDIANINANMPEIPFTWRWVHLGDIVRVLGGKRIPAGRKLTIENTGHKYIRISDMKNRSVDAENLLYVPEDIYPSISQYIIRKEDVYITVAGTIGRVGKIPKSVDGANLTENADRLVFSNLDQNWLIYCLSSTFVQKQIEYLTTQVAQPKLAIKRIQEFLVPLPPLAEQKRIVAKLEELLPLCEG